MEKGEEGYKSGLSEKSSIGPVDGAQKRTGPNQVPAPCKVDKAKRDGNSFKIK